MLSQKEFEFPICSLLVTHILSCKRGFILFVGVEVVLRHLEFENRNMAKGSFTGLNVSDALILMDYASRFYMA